MHWQITTLAVKQQNRNSMELMSAINLRKLGASHKEAKRMTNITEFKQIVVNARERVKTIP